MASLPRGNRQTVTDHAQTEHQHSSRSAIGNGAGKPNTSHLPHSQNSIQPLATSPSDRATRSSANSAAESKSTAGDLEPTDPEPTSATKTPAKSRKRKALARSEPSSPTEGPYQSPHQQPSVRRSKRQKTVPTPFTPATTASTRSSKSSRRSVRQDTAMSSNEYFQDMDLEDIQDLTISRSSTKQHDDTSKQSSSKSSSRGQSRSKRSDSKQAKSPSDLSPPSQPASSRKLRKKQTKKDADVEMKDNEQDSKASRPEKHSTPPPIPTDSNDDMSPDESRASENDPFASALFGGHGAPAGLSSTLRALSGMMTGMASRFRDILNNLRRVDDPTMQMIALEELSNLLLVSNEDNLSGQFSPDPYVKELVTLMQPNPITGEENPEIMLLACRSLSNLMEAMRGSVANVVYGGAVPILCQKLLDIQYIDVAEQALSTLSQVSRDFPASIVREGGLTACLQYLDFFATGTQRTAVTTAANCCRNIPHDSFAVIRDVMPILQNVLVGHDQKVVEQGCLCVTRIIDSFKYSPDKLEQLVDAPLLKAILSLLLPGTTNLIGSNIHTEFLRVLAIVARNSPRLSAELLKLDVVDTLYQILTGVSPPSDTSDAAASIDSVVIMQALIHRPREQVYEALNVVCELLPRIKMDGTFDDFSSDSDGGTEQNKQEERVKLLNDCTRQTRRFAMVLLPTLTDAYSSTVNLSVRQKVLTAQLKMLSNLDSKVIEDALRPVPYASFLASILSQEDHPSLVMFALQASELLFERLEGIYRYQFHREGVISEIKKLASRISEVEARSDPRKDSLAFANSGANGMRASNNDTVDDNNNESSSDDDDNHDEEDDEDDGDDDIVIKDEVNIDDEDGESDSEQEDIPMPLAIPRVKDLVVLRAKAFLDKYDTESARDLREKAAGIRQDLRRLADAIREHYTHFSDELAGRELFAQLANYFDGDALESITSSELLDSGIIRLLGDILKTDTELSGNARGDFVAAFMGKTNSAKIKTTTVTSNSTAFTVLVHKLQDLLSRAEHFEVLTVHSGASENSRSSSTSLLSRQIRLKLSAGTDSDIPAHYRDIIVSIHAIATFKALDDYLKPRITLSERPSAGRRRDMLQQLANARMAQLSGAADSGLFSPFGTELSSLPPGMSPPGTSRPSSRSNLSSQPGRPPDDKSKVEKSTRRRSSRRHAQSDNTEVSPVPPPPPPPEPSTQESSSNLEIVDEKQIQDDDEDVDDPTAALDAIVGEVEEEASGDERDPGAVNMEIASSGRVTARREDGSRVYTPRQPGTPVAGRKASSDQSPATAPTSAQPSTKRPSSYAAVAATPQDWHIEFSIDGKPVPANITIYRAVHHNRDQVNDTVGRTVWAGIHEVKFRKVPGPAPVSKLSTSDVDTKVQKHDGLPPSLDGHPITSSILKLLGILHELNAGLDDVREAVGRTGIKIYPEPLASFINTKLTAKMNRQLEEPLIVASNCLPDWSEDLARSFPFLFPFETRHLFLQSTSFGYSRSITRWQNQNDNDDRRDRRRDDRPLMGRPQRQKVRIARTKMLESAMKVMDHFGPSPSILEVEYFEEVGTGLGPTLEFYSTVSKEFAKKQLKLWRENDTDPKDQYAFGKNGLFPAPMSREEQQTEKGKKILHAFKMLGMFVARSMLDSRIIDINFSPTLFKVDEDTSASIALLRTVDQDLANSMAQLQAYANKRANIEADIDMSASSKTIALQNLTIRGASLDDLGLDFTLPGYPSISLIENGANIDVNDGNVGLYVQKVLNFTLVEGIQTQVEAFRSGFSAVFPYNSLKAFTPNELVMLFGRVEEDWSIETLMDSIKADHGFNMDSKSVKNLLSVMSELAPAQRRDFLQFVTGSPRLPIGGFKSLTPMFTVVCKPSEPPYTSDDYLPSVMTCANYLKLPDYSDVGVLKNKLGVAIKEGQGAFHLS